MSDSSVFKGAGQPCLPRGPKAAPAREKVGDVWRKENTAAGVGVSLPALAPILLLSSIKVPNGRDTGTATVKGCVKVAIEAR